MAKLQHQTINLEKEDGSIITLEIWTDVGDMLEAAVTNWVVRREPHQLTADNLCEYINSKGMHKAQTKEP